MPRLTPELLTGYLSAAIPYDEFLARLPEIRKLAREQPALMNPALLDELEHLARAGSLHVHLCCVLCKLLHASGRPEDRALLRSVAQAVLPILVLDQCAQTKRQAAKHTQLYSPAVPKASALLDQLTACRPEEIWPLLQSANTLADFAAITDHWRNVVAPVIRPRAPDLIEAALQDMEIALELIPRIN